MKENINTEETVEPTRREKRNPVKDVTQSVAEQVAKMLRSTGAKPGQVYDDDPTEYQKMILLGFSRKHNRHNTTSYGGTVDPVTVAERRAKNKVARKQRKANSRRNKR